MQLLAGDGLFKELQDAYPNNNSVRYTYFIFPYNIANV
jgi:hypothetical protein